MSIEIERHKRHRIAYDHFVNNIPYITIAAKYSVSIEFIKKFLTQIVTDTKMREAYLPKEFENKLDKQPRKAHFKFSGYYDYITDEMIIGETPHYEYDTVKYENIFYLEIDRLSFTEKLQSEIKRMVVGSIISSSESFPTNAFQNMHQ